MLLDQADRGRQSVHHRQPQRERLPWPPERQRYATMLEQAQVRRSEVAQRLLKFKSDESVQDEQLKAEREKLDAVEAEINRLMGERTAAEENIAGPGAGGPPPEQEFKTTPSSSTTPATPAWSPCGIWRSAMRATAAASAG